MSTKLVVMNYMRGSGGEFIMNLLGGILERSHRHETFNKFIWDDPIPGLSIVFDMWADAICNGYDDLRKHLFYKKYNGNLSDTNTFMATHILPHIGEMKPKTLTDYCSYVCENLPKENKINGFCSHYKYPNIVSVNTYLPCALSVGVSISGIDINYFRFLCITKKLNSSLIKQPMPKKDFLVLFEEDMFFNKDCAFNGNTNSNFVIDAHRLFFNFDDSQVHELAEILGLKPAFDKHVLEEYTNKNMDLLKQHFGYSCGDAISENESRERILAYIDRFYAQNGN